MAKKNRKKKKNPASPKRMNQSGGLPNNVPQGGLLQKALNFHQAGNLRQAESLYRQILSKEPDNAFALHYLGVLAHQIGKHDIAVKLMQSALSNDPNYVEAHINLGIAQKSLGKFEEAISSFQGALSINPDDHLAYYNLANTFIAQGKNEKAIDCLNKAISSNPDYVQALHSLGNLLHEKRELEKAIEVYNKVLEINPSHVETLNNLGNINHELDNHAEAITNYKKAIKVNAKDPIVHNNLGNTLKEKGDLDEAIAHFKKATKLNPEFIEAYRNLGVIYRELGLMDDAARCLEKALKIKPDYIPAFRNLSLIRKYTKVDKTVNYMEDLSCKMGLNVNDRIDLGFALGKIYEDLKLYDKSFSYFSEANHYKRMNYQYDKKEDNAFFSSIKSIFSSKLFEAYTDAGIKDNTPIFILGMPRSGTTLVEQILASHPDIFGAGELDILEKLIDSIQENGSEASFPDSMKNLGQNSINRIGEEYIKEIRKYSIDAPKITDKMPYNFLYIGLIKLILPEAKVIHCYRDPMDTCFSIYKTEFAGSHKYAYDLLEIGNYYNLYKDLMDYWESVLPGFIYNLSYEELVSDHHGQTKKLLEYCGLPWDDSCLDFNKTKRRVRTASLAQVRQPIYQDSIELWKNYETELRPLIKAVKH